VTLSPAGGEHDRSRLAGRKFRHYQVEWPPRRIGTSPNIGLEWQ
jgi:hypothetical protein